MLLITREIKTFRFLLETHLLGEKMFSRSPIFRRAPNFHRELSEIYDSLDDHVIIAFKLFRVSFASYANLYHTAVNDQNRITIHNTKELGSPPKNIRVLNSRFISHQFLETERNSHPVFDLKYHTISTNGGQLDDGYFIRCLIFLKIRSPFNVKAQNL